jgi:hypothetical protein
MTQDEMIELARQAGFAEPERIISTDTVRCVPDLAYFAELIKRPWVGLTHGEVIDIYEAVMKADVAELVDNFARALEAKLKEKNT